VNLASDRSDDAISGGVK